MIDDAQPTTKRSRLDRIVRQAFGNEHSKSYATTNTFIALVIVASIFLMMFSTVGSLYHGRERFFLIAEIVVLLIFIAEYAANVYIAEPKREYVCGFWGVIDLLAIAPGIVLLAAEGAGVATHGAEHLGSSDIGSIAALRAARVFRVLRFLRLLRILKLLKVVAENYRKSQNQRTGTFRLDMEIYCTALFSALVLTSALVYYAESGVENTPFTSIPISMWWSIITMTTTGYGDMYPVTVAGRIIAGGTALIGLALFALLMNVMGKSMLQGLFAVQEEQRIRDASDPAKPVLDDIERLSRLREANHLSDEEFARAKAALLKRLE